MRQLTDDLRTAEPGLLNGGFRVTRRCLSCGTRDRHSVTGPEASPRGVTLKVSLSGPLWDTRGFGKARPQHVVLTSGGIVPSGAFHVSRRWRSHPGPRPA